MVLAYLAETRPKQWIKNLLVFAAPAAAGLLFHGTVLRHSFIEFICFILASAGIYTINDLLDAPADRKHPTKSRRPIAAGEIDTREAAVFAGALLLVANLLPYALLPWQGGIVVNIYTLVTIAYSIWLKHEPVLDIVAVAVGFLLRAIAGGLAANLPLSNWFLIVTSFGSLFMVTGKRFSELSLLGDKAGSHRRSLDVYTSGYLNFSRSISAAITIVGYCLWAFQKSATLHHGAIWVEVSILPFVVAILRYSLRIEQGETGSPEEVILSDITLLLTGVIWAALLGVGIFIYKA